MPRRISKKLRQRSGNNWACKCELASEGPASALSPPPLAPPLASPPPPTRGPKTPFIPTEEELKEVRSKLRITSPRQAAARGVSPIERELKEAVKNREQRMTESATKLQAAARGAQVRKTAKAANTAKAATKLQAAARGAQARKTAKTGGRRTQKRKSPYKKRKYKSIF